jgi:hypothetical protein
MMELQSPDINDPLITQKGIKAGTLFYRTMAIDQWTNQGVSALVSGIDSPFLNLVIDTQFKQNDLSEIIDSIVDFYKPYQVPWAWLVTPLSHPSDLKLKLTEHGFTLLEEVPCMYRDLTLPLTLIENKALHFEEIKIDKHLTEWIEPIREGFPGEDGGEKYRLLNEKIGKQTNSLKQFILRHEGKVASSGTLFLAKDCVMIHNLATKTAALKQGLGSALTIYMMQEAKHLGFKDCYLESSEEGFGLYKKLGFKTHCYNQYYSL